MSKPIKKSEVEIIWVEQRLARLALQTTEGVKEKIACIHGKKIRMFVMYCMKGLNRFQAFIRCRGKKFRVRELDPNGVMRTYYRMPKSPNALNAIKVDSYRLSHRLDVQQILLEHRKTEYAQTDAPALAWGNRQAMSIVLQCRRQGDIKNAIAGLKLIGEWNNWGKRTTDQSVEVDTFLEKLRRSISSATKETPDTSENVKSLEDASSESETAGNDPDRKQPPRLVEISSSTSVVPKYDPDEKDVKLPPQQPPHPSQQSQQVKEPEELPAIKKTAPRQIIHVPVKTPKRAVGTVPDRLNSPAIRKTAGNMDIRPTPDSE